MEKLETVVEVDARGLYCPIPVLRLAAALRCCPPGARARLLATDPAAAADVDAFCRETGAGLITSGEQEGVLVFDVQKAVLSD
ncbi:MAG: sulfurtransferase TusA family protein [Acidobacteriota bacterium]